MFKFIKKIYTYLFRIKTINNIDKKNQIDKPSIVGAITFKLYDDQTIDISCHVPETEKLSSDQMTSIAENYAELLAYINDGLLSTKIIDFIKETIAVSEYEQDKLFFENVLVFWAIHHSELIKSKKTKSNQPLIMPSRVFNP
jgi:hypothetical protein